MIWNKSNSWKCAKTGTMVSTFNTSHFVVTDYKTIDICTQGFNSYSNYLNGL